MKLENSKGEYFQLKILGYQFPHIIDDKWDSNWLNIGIEVKHAKKETWTAVDPCLLTFEVERLSDWLETIITDYRQAKPAQEFTEPSLKFVLSIAENCPILRIYFDKFLRPVRPKWEPGRKKPREELWSEFPIEENDLSEVVHSLRSQLKNYPMRAL